jgi:hypothetical protein
MEVGDPALVCVWGGNGSVSLRSTTAALLVGDDGPTGQQGGRDTP